MAVAEAIADVESRGAGGYKAVSDKTRYGKAYGKYQVLQPNIAKWTKEAVGKAMTPKEFLNDPEAQDLTAGHVIQRLLGLYEPKTVAVIWFTGEAEPDPNIQDVYGTTPAEYKQKFALYY